MNTTLMSPALLPQRTAVGKELSLTITVSKILPLQLQSTPVRCGK